MKTFDGQIYEIDLDEHPSTRWDEVGEVFQDEIGELLDDCVAQADELIETSPYANVIRTLLGPLGRVAGVISGVLGQEYPTEIKGLASAANVSYPHLLLANLMYDLSGASFLLGCSSYSTVIDGNPVLVRNLDWAMPESIGKYNLLIRFNKGNRSYLSFGIPGLVGVLSAMSPGKWATTLNMAASDDSNYNPWSGIPTLMHLRSVCDQFGGFHQFKNRIMQYQTITPFYLHLIGSKPEQRMIIEGYGDSYSSLEAGDEPLIQTNHSVIDDSAPEVDANTHERYEAIKRRLTNKHPKNLEEALSILKRKPVTYEGTIHSMALNPSASEYIFLTQ